MLDPGNTAHQLFRITVDRHYLHPLFNPRSLVVFAGDPDAEAPTREARTLRQALAAGGFAGSVTWLDVAMTGTLSDLASSRADLALIALPADDSAAALEIVGRIRCRAAMVLGSGLSPALCTELHQIARRHGVPYVFKASFDKANRTSVQSYRGPGLAAGLKVLGDVAPETRAVLADQLLQIENPTLEESA